MTAAQVEALRRELAATQAEVRMLRAEKEKLMGDLLNLYKLICERRDSPQELTPSGVARLQ